MTISLFPEVAAGFDTPLEMLEACHERVQAQLRTLSRLVAWLPQHGADAEAQQAATRVMHYFDTAAANHHADEEDDLCPALLRQVGDDQRAALMTLIDWIKTDHVYLHAAWAELRECLEAVSQGRHADLAEKVATFTKRYERHIEREEGELLPFARALLSEQDLEEMTETMTARRRYVP